MGGGLNDYKPAMAMVVLQFIYAGVNLSSRVALLQGMSPSVFVVYRHATATLFLAPLAYFTGNRAGGSCLGLRCFCLIFLSTFIGVTAQQNFYFEGIYMASSTAASVMFNLVAALTFVLAAILGLEKINIRSPRTIAKILGTILCVGGAISMALLRGPKLLNTELLTTKSLFGPGNENFLLGCVFCFGSSCCWAVWFNLQVPVTTSHPDNLSLSAWMCFMATIQSAVVAFLAEKDPKAWNFNSYLELLCCLFSGIIGSGLAFFLQAWCISRRGPLFSAMFNPLCTVIVTIIAAIFLHEEIYTGSLIGAIGVIVGLYVVLWGKAEDIAELNLGSNRKPQFDQEPILQINVEDESLEKVARKVHLEEPLLSAN